MTDRETPVEFIHEPVLLQEVLQWMAPQPGGVYCDGSLGGGGPRADTYQARRGCYAFPMPFLVHHEGVERGLEIRTVREVLAELVASIDQFYE